MKEDWACLHSTATVGELAPTIQINKATAIAQGLGLSSLGSAGNPIMLGSIQGSQAPGDNSQKAITSGKPDPKKTEEQLKHWLPKVDHVKYAGPDKTHVWLMMVHSDLAFTSTIPSITEGDILLATKCALDGTVIVTQNFTFHRTGRDTQLTFFNHPLDEEAGNIAENIVVLFTKQLPGASPTCKHGELLMQMILTRFRNMEVSMDHPGSLGRAKEEHAGSPVHGTHCGHDDPMCGHAPGVLPGKHWWLRRLGHLCQGHDQRA